MRIAAGTDDIDRAGGRLDRDHLAAHGGNGTQKLVDRFAFCMQADQEFANLRRRNLAFENQIERRARLFGGKIMSFGEYVEKWRERHRGSMNRQEIFQYRVAVLR